MVPMSHEQYIGKTYIERACGIVSWGCGWHLGGVLGAERDQKGGPFPF